MDQTMNQCTVNSFDLAQLRALSRRLVKPGVTEVAPESSVADESTGFSALPPLAARSEKRPSRPSAVPPPPLLDPSELVTWDALLAWSMELCRSRAGFVVDSQGFVIASRGNVPDDGFEGTGAELCFAMEQMDKLDAEGAVLRAVELQYEGYTLASIRIPGAGGEAGFILGFVGSRPLIPEVRDAIINQAGMGLEFLA